MTKIYLTPDDHRTITDALYEAHARLLLIRSGLNCAAGTAHHLSPSGKGCEKDPTLDDVRQSVELLSETLGETAEELGNLMEAICVSDGDL